MHGFLRSPLAWVVVLAGVLTAVFAVVLARLQVQHQGDAAAQNVQALLWCLWLPGAALWACLSLLAVRLLRHQGYAPTLPQNVIVILGVALLVRLFVVFTTSPQLSDDIWRYIHDGQTLLQGQSPYAAPPAVSMSPIAQRVNHPHLVSIYQPASQQVFAALALLARGVDPWGDRVFRLGFVAFDMGIIALLLVKLRQQWRSPWWATLYAWHPLVISEVAGSGHQDVVGIFLLLGGLLLGEQMGQRRLHAVWCGVAFAAAIAVKPLVLPAALLCAWSQRRHVGALMIACAAGAGMLAALYLPFAETLAQNWQTVAEFAEHWRFNAGFHWFLEHALNRKRATDVVCALVLMVVLGWVLIRRTEVWSASGLYLAAALLLSSTVHPWYLLWALALLVIHFRSWVWVWSLTIAWSYAALVDPLRWGIPTAVWAAEYGLVFAAMLASLCLAKSHETAKAV